MDNPIATFNRSYIGRRDDILGLVPARVHRVLDVGCSIGATGEFLKSRYQAEVVGIEYEPEMAKVAEKVLDRVIVGDVEQLELNSLLPEQYFDCIIFGDVLEHLKDPWQLLSTVSNHLSPDGVIIVSIPNVRHYSTILALLFGRWPYRDRGIHDRTHLRFFTLHSIKDMLTQAGFAPKGITRNYRILERPSALNVIAGVCHYLPFREFFTFQYLVVAHKANQVEKRLNHNNYP